MQKLLQHSAVLSLGVLLAFLMGTQPQATALADDQVKEVLVEKRAEKRWDVRFLIATQQDFIGPSFGLGGGGQSGASIVIEEEATLDEPFDPDSLVEVIENQVAPGTWDLPNNISFRSGYLVVRHSKKVIQEVDALLNLYQKDRLTEVVVSLHAYAVDRSALSAWAAAGWFTGTFSKEHMMTLGKEGLFLGVVGTRGANTQRVNAVNGNTQFYVADYTAVTNKGVTELDPEISIFFEGTILDVQPVLSVDQKFIRVELRLKEFSDTFLSDRAVDPKHKVQLPKAQNFALNQTVIVDNGGQVALLGPKKGKDQQVVYVVSAQKISR